MSAVYNQIIRHNSKTDVFSKLYLNKKVRFDVQAAFLDQSSTDRLTKAFTYISFICDLCASKDVSEEVMKALPSDLVIVELKKDWWKLYKTIQKEY
jgi:hypothetical protein